MESACWKSGTQPCLFQMGKPELSHRLSTHKQLSKQPAPPRLLLTSPYPLAWKAEKADILPASLQRQQQQPFTKHCNTFSGPKKKRRRGKKERNNNKKVFLSLLMLMVRPRVTVSKHWIGASQDNSTKSFSPSIQGRSTVIKPIPTQVLLGQALPIRFIRGQNLCLHR